MFACGGSFHSLNPTRIVYSVPIVVFVRVLLLSLCTLLVQGPRSVSSIPVSEFFPFGTDSGDHTTERSDDGGSGRINLTVMFPFFGHRHDKLYVNNNGVISFFNELRVYRPEDFPLKDLIPIIAPFWADVDISKSNGSVFYRESRDPLLLSKATNEIRAFPAYKYFQAYWLFVATWDEVGFFGAVDGGLDKKNTFQAVLVLDTSGRLSFVILNYAKIEWTTGLNSIGNVSTGLGGVPAQAGFNAGDNVSHFEIEGAGTDSVINLTQTSNMGVPGKWIFRIDSREIQDVCSQSGSGSVAFHPGSSSMLGGEPISISGLCFDPKVREISVEGRLATEDGQSESVCCFIENSTANCYLPPVLFTGFVNISLNIGGRGWNYSGILEIKNIIDMPVDVHRYSPTDWVAGNSVSVSWKYNFLAQAESYQIDLLIFKVNDGISSLQVLGSEPPQKKQDSGKYQLHLPLDFEEAQVAVVRVTALPNNCSTLAGPSIWSDVFPVRYSDVLYSHSLCSNWLIAQSKLTPLNIPGHCPCTLRQAEGDTAQYFPDPFCSRRSEFISHCFYRSQSTSQCIMPHQVRVTDGTYVCCYDKDSGELLIALEGDGGGTMQRYHVRQSGQNIVPYFTYMQEEIAPYLHCCELSKKQPLCEQYLKVRPPVDCQGYQPPAAAQAAGDPHIVTLDSYSYTFNGIGEFTLLRVQDAQATVQVRATPVKNNQNQPQNATVFSAVAMRASNTSSILEIRLRKPGEQDLVSVYKDSELLSLSSSTSQLSEMTIHTTDSENGTLELTVVMTDIGLSLLIQATDELLNIMVMAGSQLKGRIEGLLGDYNGDSQNDLAARDGTVLDANASMRDIHNIFGMSWFISENESLFTVVPVSEFDKSSTENAQNVFYSAYFSDEIQNNEIPSNIKKACNGNPQCQFDYIVSDNEAIALSTLKFNKRYEERKNDVSEVVRCPYFGADDIANGNRNLTGLQVGNVVTVECNNGYSVNGSDKIVCNENGEWNSYPTCVRVIPPDESLPVTIAVGAAIGGFVLVVLVVVLIKVACKKSPNQKFSKSVVGSEGEHKIELPILFPISNIPSPVFENSLFMSSLHKLSENGNFQIPRPTFVDPNIYSEYF